MGKVLTNRGHGLYTGKDGAPGDLGIATYRGVEYLAGKFNDGWKYIALDKVFEGRDKEAFKNIKDFGALGNNTANEVFAINRAKAALKNGGTIYFSPGEYYIAASEIDIETKNRHSGSGGNAGIRGDGDSKMFRQKASTNLDMVSFDNLLIDGDSPNGPTNPGNVSGGHGIDLYRSGQTSANSIISNMWIKDVGGDGVYLRGSDKNILHGMNIDVNWQAIGANLRGRNGIAITDGDSLIIANCYIKGGGNAGIDLEPNATESINRVVITNCVIEDSLYGIAMPGGSGATPPISHVTISNCVIRVGDNSATGFNIPTVGIVIAECETISLSNVWILGQSDITKTGTGILLDRCSRIYMNNVNVTGCKRGIQIDSSSGSTSKVSIIGGEVYENYEHGLSLVGTAGNHIKNLIISGVMAFNNDHSEGGFDGIRVSYCDHVSIVGCHAFDDQGTETQNIGITVNNSDSVTVVGNDCYGNLSYQIYLYTNTGNEFGHNSGAVTVAEA